MNHDKIRDMTRSILPSRARTSARGRKKVLHHGHRRSVRQMLHDYSRDDHDEDVMDVIDAKMHVANAEYKREINFIVSERRDADKIRPFIRWAREKTTHLETMQDKYYGFVSLIGGADDVIKKHAVGHFINPRYDFQRDYPWWERDNARTNRPIPREDFAEELRPMMDDPLMVKALNKVLRKCGISVDPCAKDAKCWKNNPKTTRRTALWDVAPDGTRKRVYIGHEYVEGQSVLNVKSQFIGGYTISYNRSHDGEHHDNNSCDNILRLDDVSLDRVVKILYRRPNNFVLPKMLAEMRGDA